MKSTPKPEANMTSPNISLSNEAHCQAMSQAGEHYAPDCPRCASLPRPTIAAKE